MTNDASGDARCVIAAATSSGRPTRPRGVCSSCHSRIAARSSGLNAEWSAIGVSIAPGATAATRIPRGASCTAQLRVSESRAAFPAA